MTTFERVRRNIRRDMDAIRVHTPESWAHILLTNTGRLTDEREQEKFWSWLENPEEHEMDGPTIGIRGEFSLTPSVVTVPFTDVGDEKEMETEVELENTFERNGFVMVCRTKPVHD